MGNSGSKAKSVINSLSEQITQVAAETVLTCEVSSGQVQSLDSVNSGFKLWSSAQMIQTTDVDSKCFSDSTRQLELQNKVINAISQSTTADGLAVLSAFGASKSSATTNLSSIVRNNVTMSNIQKQYTAIQQSQTAKFTNSGVIIVESIKLTQGSQIFAAATLKVLDTAGVFNTIEAHVTQQTAAETSGIFDFGMTGYILILVVIIAIIAVFWVKPSQAATFYRELVAPVKIS